VVATDADLPANTITYTLLAGPPGATVSPDGIFRWTPGEADGGTTSTVVVEARDNGTPALSATTQFLVTVREVNEPPVLSVPGDQTLEELSTFHGVVTATDADLPPNTLTIRLVDPPAGMTFDAATGAIEWTPTEAQGPSTHVITVVVTDTNPAATENASISVTNTFTLVVTEVNVAPTLEPVEDQSLHYGTPLSIALEADDTDEPANTLTFALEEGPAGLDVNPTTGVISWTPSQSQVGEHTVTVVVSDDATPPLTAKISFKITVTGEGATVSIARGPGGLIQIRSTGENGLDYELQASLDLITWTRLVEFQFTGTPHVYIDPDSDPNALVAPVRFYRLQLKQR
jgi:hypothetical protein